MGRMGRVTVPGLPHHVTQRGNLNAPIFARDGDRGVYLAMFQKSALRRGLAIWAYCLMTNHVHFVVVPRFEDSLSLALRDAHSAYANWFNKQARRPGNLWRNRFHSCVMDEPHLWAAVRYVERNPVSAHMIGRAEEYPWSSAAPHCGLRKDPLLAEGFPFPNIVADWPAWLSNEDVERTAEIRKCTRLGLPCGSAEFTGDMEAKARRPLRHKKPGRPRK
jgi:putative transposase